MSETIGSVSKSIGKALSGVKATNVLNGAASALGTLAEYRAAKEKGKVEAQVTEVNAENNRVATEYNAQSVLNAGEYNARVADENAKIYDIAAADAIQRGADEAGDERDLAKRANATARATMGSSGGVVDSGTRLRLQADNAGYGEMNALSVMNNAEREAYGLRTAGKDARAQATGIRYSSGLDAENLRLAGKVGYQGAQMTSAAQRYAANADASTVLINAGKNAGKYAGSLYEPTTKKKTSKR